MFAKRIPFGLPCPGDLGHVRERSSPKVMDVEWKPSHHNLPQQVYFKILILPASMASSKVVKNESINDVGISEIKPTVSMNITGILLGRKPPWAVTSNVANS